MTQDAAGVRQLRVLVVDDEPPARAKLRRLLTAEPDVAIVGEAADGAAALECIRRLQPDVVFLDVRMPHLDGFGVVDAVGVEAMPRTVFVTAYDEHAVRAFEVHAVDYLLKPVTPARFASALARLRREVARDDAPPGAGGGAPSGVAVLEALHHARHGPRHVERLLLHTENRAVFVPVERIDWIEADRNYLRIHVGAEVFVQRGTVAALVESLDPARFLRLNRSQIVRVDAVRELHPWSHGDYHVMLTTGQTLTWSRRFRAASEHHFRLGSPDTSPA